LMVIFINSYQVLRFRVLQLKINNSSSREVYNICNEQWYTADIELSPYVTEQGYAIV